MRLNGRTTQSIRLAVVFATVAALLIGISPRAVSFEGLGSFEEVSGGRASVIVQSAPELLDEAVEAVEAAGGVVGEFLPIVDGFAADLPERAIDLVRQSSGVRAVTHEQRVVFEEVSYDSTTTASNFVRTTGGTSAWSKGGLGTGIGVAVIDTGISSMNDFSGRLVFGPDLSGEGTTVDSYGHGTVMAGLIGGGGTDSATNSGGAFTGVAPKATVISVKVAGRNGVTDVSTVLQAMHWVSAYKHQFNIRVLSLSWGTPATQDPGIDPLNFAVQRLWQQGITVVVAAGNSGPSSQTIRKPGDDPLVITAGAFNDSQNLDPADDVVPGWSSRGPTFQGLVKPDVVAPGRSLVAARSFGSYVEATYPKALISPSYIKGSGTSQATAVTAGIAALLLEQRPTLTPDQVKHLLKSTADAIPNTDATIQGSGRIDLTEALTADAGAVTQQTPTGTGMGSLEASRGGWNVETDCFDDGTIDVIAGEITDRCAPWEPAAWTGNSWTGNSWTGDAWTGNSWTGNSWTGNSWTGNSWTGNSWTGSTWTGNSWTGNSWTTAEYEDTGFTTAEYDDTTLYLAAFWGANPPGFAIKSLRTISFR